MQWGQRDQHGCGNNPLHFRALPQGEAVFLCCLSLPAWQGLLPSPCSLAKGLCSCPRSTENPCAPPGPLPHPRLAPGCAGLREPPLASQRAKAAAGPLTEVLLGAQDPTGLASAR